MKVARNGNVEHEKVVGNFHVLRFESAVSLIYS
jgi:hypothetical protein